MPPEAAQRKEAGHPIDPVEAELADLSYMVSHDLAAAVRHVSEFSRMLLSDLGGSLTPRQERYAERVQLAGGRCQRMLEQLLVFSRAQQKELACVTHDPATLIRMAMLQLSTEMHQSQAKVVIDPLEEVFADPDLMLLAFKHLLDNAIKFRRPETAPHIHITSPPTRNAWTIRISDDGVGVAPEYHEKAFRMFQRLNPESAYPGVGVGLTLCRRIARRHGGEVRFIDQAKGACVEMTIPHPGESL
ncbi:MAG: hypothetical protein JO303_12850 [Caulobacteraceae bacterium]|nr:hypothetical protein [Caulobacteraceae bacterium]